MHRSATTAFVAALLLIGCGHSSSRADKATDPVARNAVPLDERWSPATQDEPQGPDPMPAIGQNDGLIDSSISSTEEQSAETAPVGPSDAEFHLADVLDDPHVPNPPEPGADAPDIAAFVAEVWAGSGVPELAWPDAVDRYLTADFADASVSVDRTSLRSAARTFRAVHIHTTATSSGQRAIVTLEEVATIDVEPLRRLLVVEVLLVPIDEHWLVASLEVIA